ncbi:MAG: tetratricopeptide repeat protein [Acidobacteria bacterium]|nr:tetratricopeptide repeat protein [Acidobacteriota bacterium]MDA1235926.1 tetratricopeptide repeat protein [Acidobacteriota bacterium]
MLFLRCNLALIVALSFAACSPSGPDPATAERLQELRNLGKAFYENPTGAEQAVETFKQALELAPDSVREKINYALAQLRAGAREEGMAALQAAQKLDPSIPHTWFNLGVELKQLGETEPALEQFERMAELVPDEPKTQYNLGQLYRQLGRDDDARARFERASALDPSLAAPHFQLFNMLRRSDPQAAQEQLEEFQRIQKIQQETDLAEDVNWSFYSEIYDPVDPGQPADFVETVHFESSPVGVVEAGGGILLLDVDHDARTDALAWSAGRLAFLKGDGATLTAADQPNLTAAWSGVQRVAAGDPNNDGFPDLCMATGAGILVASNAAGTFAAPARLDSDPAESCLWHDYDHDGDQDLFVLGERSRLYRFALDARQALAAGLKQEPFPFGDHGKALDAIAVELFEDNGLDLVIAYEDAIRVHQDFKLGVYGEAVEVADSRPSPGRVRLEARDIDSDGFLDVSVSGGAETVILGNQHGSLASVSRVPAVLAWIDTQNRGWSDKLTASGVSFNQGAMTFSDGNVEGLPSVASAAAADFNADGRTDLLVIDDQGQVHLAANQTQTDNHWISLHLTGVKSRIVATDARVEAKAGLLYAKAVYPGHPITIGLGRQNSVETIRITWPNGLIQNETQQEFDRRLAIEEKPRLSGSCPMIFTWNGKQFEYISEVLGVAPLGASLGNGQFFPVDHDEYVLLNANQLVERDGFFDVRVTEELREVAYIDQVRLIAIDSPAGVDVITNEKFKAPPFPKFQLFGVAESDKVRPVQAVDQLGRDVLSTVLHRDGQYVDGFRRTFSNTAELHSLTVDMAGLKGDRSTTLFLTGWVDWSSASTIVAGSQTSSSGVQPPVIQVRDAKGDWTTVDSDPGLPGGNPRTMAVDLTGRFLSDSREIRILTNMCVYWDEVYAVDGIHTLQADRHEAPLDSAELRFRGFSQNVVHPQRLEPEKFIYSQVRSTTAWDPTTGLYTDYGTVKALLAGIDDRFVVMGSGDEIQLRFHSNLPPVNPGSQRHYLLFFDGWAKEHDPNTAFGDTVEPLPFHQMSGYPYGESESFPDEAWREIDPLTKRQALRLNRPLYAR